MSDDPISCTRCCATVTWRSYMSDDPAFRICDGCAWTELDELRKEKAKHDAGADALAIRYSRTVVDAHDAGRAAGAAEERARIVAWLRANGYRIEAGRIESVEHLK